VVSIYRSLTVISYIPEKDLLPSFVFPFQPRRKQIPPLHFLSLSLIFKHYAEQVGIANTTLEETKQDLKSNEQKILQIVVHTRQLSALGTNSSPHMLSNKTSAQNLNAPKGNS